MIEAVIWDLNGVIIDDMNYHFLSFQAFLREIGYEMTKDYFISKCTGTPPNEVFAEILPAVGSPITIEEAISRKRSIYFDLIRGNMQMLPGVRQLILGIHSMGLKQAIASGATRIEVETIINEFGIEPYFDVVIACEDVSKGKPDPEPFVAAAERLGMHPFKCAVIEDGEFGIRAAKSCGMKAIAVTNTQSREKLAGADIIVNSLEEIRPEELLKL